MSTGRYKEDMNQEQEGRIPVSVKPDPTKNEYFYLAALSSIFAMFDDQFSIFRPNFHVQLESNQLPKCFFSNYILHCAYGQFIQKPSVLEIF